MTPLSIALYEQDIRWHEPAANREAAERHFDGITADILVVPETFTTGFGEGMAALAEEPEGETLRWARRLAARKDALVVGSWIVRTEGDGCRNRLHWVRPDGDYGFYDKAHLFRVSGEADQLSRGTARPTFTWRGWRIRPAVCYDLRFPSWLRNRALDYDLLLLCANWPQGRREAWTTLIKARAIENLCYVAACNRCGQDIQGTPYSGDSAVIDYRGFALPASDVYHLDLQKLIDFRQRWPFHLDFDE